MKKLKNILTQFFFFILIGSLSACGSDLVSSLVDDDDVACNFDFCRDEDSDGLFANCDADDNDANNRNRVPDCIIIEDPYDGGGDDDDKSSFDLSIFDRDKDGIINNCDADPDNALIKNILAKCDDDLDGLINGSCRTLLRKNADEPITDADYDAVKNNCDNCEGIFNENGNADKDNDGLGDDCDRVDNRIVPEDPDPPVDPYDDAPEEIDDPEGVVYVSSLRFNDPEGEGERGSKTNPYGYRALVELMGIQDFSIIRILGNGSIPTNLTINRNLELVGGFACTAEFNDGLCNAEGAYLYEVERLDENGDLIYDELPILNAQRGAPAITVQNRVSSTIKGFRISGANTGNGANAILISSSSATIEYNYIRQSLYTGPDADPTRAILINATAFDIVVNISNNVIDNGHVDIEQCTLQRAQGSNLVSAVYADLNYPAGESNTHFRITNNKIYSGMGQSVSGIRFTDSVRRGRENYQSYSHILNNEIISSCGANGGVIGIDSFLPLIVDSNIFKLDSFKDFSTSIIALKLRDQIEFTNLRSTFSNNLVELRGQIQDVFAGENQFSMNLTAVLAKDAYLDLFSNTFKLSAAAGDLKVGLFHENVLATRFRQAPEFANDPSFDHKSNIINNIFLFEPQAEVQNNMPDAIVLYSKAQINSFNNNEEFLNFGVLSHNVIMGGVDKVTYVPEDPFANPPLEEVIEVVEEVPDQDLQFFNIDTDVNPQIRGEIAIINFRTNNIADLGLDLSDHKPNRRDGLILGNGYIFRDINSNGDQIPGPVLDLDGLERSIQNQTVGCYEFQSNLE